MTAGEKPRPLLVYVLAVVLLAPLGVATLWALDLGSRSATVPLLLVMGALAGARPVRVPGMRHEITATHPFIFLALAAVGPLAAVLVALVGVCGAALGRPGRWPDPVRFAFNLGAVCLSTIAACWTFRLLGGATDAPLVALLGPLAGATSTYFFANTGLVAAAIAIEKRRSLLTVWRQSFLYTVVSYSSGLTLAVALLAVLEVMLPWGLLLAAAVCTLLVLSYRAHAGRMEAQGSG